MSKILRMFSKYYATYNPRSKVLRLYGKVPVKEFVYLKSLLKCIREEVSDIRISKEGVRI